MKIVFVAPFGFGQKTTVWARTLPLAKELVKQGHEVALLVPPWDTPADSGKHYQEDGVEIINVSIRGGLPFTILRLLYQIRRLQPELVHIVKPRAHAGIIQWLLWQLRRWKISPFTIHHSQFTIYLDLDDWEQAWQEINHYGWLTSKFLAWQEEWGIRHADGLTVASRWLEQRAQQYAAETPILYLPNGVVVDGERERGGERENNHRVTEPQPAILYLTRYVEVEPEWLVCFSSSLHEALPQSHLIIAGEPLQPGRDQIFQLALQSSSAPTTVTSDVATDKDSRRNPQSPFTFLGKVIPAQINELYRQVACAIFPSAPTVLQQAKCSVRLATTLLHGVPVVASAVGEQTHYGAEGAARLVAAEATPEEFAAAVVELLNDPAQQQSMIQRAHEHLARNYQWQALGERLEKWYMRTIQSRQR
ncbi:MAG: glycosyltransferase family 4 protein [Caldilineaceae bacterium]